MHFLTCMNDVMNVVKEASSPWKASQIACATGWVLPHDMLTIRTPFHDYLIQYLWFHFTNHIDVFLFTIWCHLLNLYLYRSLAPYGIFVTNVNAGPIRTGFTDRFGNAEQGGKGTRKVWHTVHVYSLCCIIIIIIMCTIIVNIILLLMSTV